MEDPSTSTPVSTAVTSTPVSTEEGTNAFWARLLHRWCIEYNPLYLLSATLVLIGTMLWSRGLAQEGNVYGSLGVAAVAELYAAALLGGAALLVRIGQRRPAVMLALLTVIYQGDLTLHTETCAYLGTAGALASALWFALFVAKLRALAGVFQIQIPARSFATALLGALGLALIPRALPLLEPSQRGALIAWWLFSLLVLHQGERATSLAPLDAWGAVVLRRALRATWLLWLGLTVAHIYMWSTAQTLDIVPALPAMALLAVPRIQRESRIWLLVGPMFVFAACFFPATLFLHALLMAMALAVRAWPKTGLEAVSTASASPYRTVEASPSHWTQTTAVAPLGDGARKRLFVGAMGGLYLSVWTLRWSGGAWPEHSLALDLALTLTMLLFAWRMRTRLPALPPVACVLHGIAASGLVPIPHSLAGWGSAIIVMGFTLLFASLATSYGLRNTFARRPSACTAEVPGTPATPSST